MLRGADGMLILGDDMEGDAARGAGADGAGAALGADGAGEGRSTARGAGLGVTETGPLDLGSDVEVTGADERGTSLCWAPLSSCGEGVFLVAAPRPASSSRGRSNTLLRPSFRSRPLCGLTRGSGVFETDDSPSTRRSVSGGCMSVGLTRMLSAGIWFSEPGRCTSTGCLPVLGRRAEMAPLAVAPVVGRTAFGRPCTVRSRSITLMGRRAPAIGAGTPPGGAGLSSRGDGRVGSSSPVMIVPRPLTGARGIT
jgi:hypothetical protein